MNSKLFGYYKKKIYGGRSIIARALDFIILRALIFFIIFVVLFYFSLSTTLSLLISFFITVAFSLALLIFNRKKIEKYMARDMIRLKQKCMLEKLTFMNINEFMSYINRIMDNKIKNMEITEGGFKGKFEDYGFYALHNHPECNCEVPEVLKIYRSKTDKKIIILSLSDFSNDTKRMCTSVSPEIKLIDGKEILEAARRISMLPDEKEAEKNAEKEMNESIVTLEKFKKTAFSRAKIKSYAICGAIILFWPLITGFRIYYLIIATVCFLLAIITYRRSKQHSEGRSDIGIS